MFLLYSFQHLVKNQFQEELKVVLFSDSLHLQPKVKKMIDWNLPFFLNPEIAIEEPQQVVTGHDAAGKEVPAEPVGISISLKILGILLVRENMNKVFSVRLKPGANAAKQFLVILHVFEHFYGYYTIVLPLNFQIVHIAL